MVKVSCNTMALLLCCMVLPLSLLIPGFVIISNDSTNGSAIALIVFGIIFFIIFGIIWLVLYCFIVDAETAGGRSVRVNQNAMVVTNSEPISVTVQT